MSEEHKAEDALEKVVQDRQRLKGLEDRLTETGIQLLAQKAAQKVHVHHDRSPLPGQQHVRRDIYQAVRQRNAERRQQEQGHHSREK